MIGKMSKIKKEWRIFFFDEDTGLNLEEIAICIYVSIVNNSEVRIFLCS